MGRKIREWDIREPLAEKEDGLSEISEMSEDERVLLEREISCRVTKWLEWYLGKNPEKYEAFAGYMEQKHI